MVNRTHEIRKEKLPVTIAGIPKLIARGLIRCYQVVLSPFIGNQCRFHPSCSVYSMQSIERFGALRGSWLTVRRLGRCQPFCDGGLDPVPARPPGLFTRLGLGAADDHSSNRNPS